MASFHDQLNRAQSIKPEIISKELFDFIRTVRDYLVEMNRKQIRENSEDIYGKAIGFYSRATELISEGRKKQGDPFTGEDTGDWLKGFYVTVLDDMFFFGSSDPKTDDIMSSDSWLSYDLFGLTEENLNRAIQDVFLPFVIKNYRKKLKL